MYLNCQYYLSTLSIDFNKISKNKIKEPREEAKNHKPTLFVYQKMYYI